MSTSPAPSAPLGLVDCFCTLTDPRIDRTKQHLLIDVVVIGFCTILAGGEGFTDMEEFGQAKEPWFRTFLELPNGIPRHDTFNRVFQALDPEEFFGCFLNWTESLRKAVSGEIVALDGKALRRATGQGGGRALPYMVSAWATDNGLALGQVKVDEKSNEITAIPVLLRALALNGCIVTIDAMGCQRKIAREIVDADADYVLALKGNQETVHEEVKSYMDDAVTRWTKAPASAIELPDGRIVTGKTSPLLGNCAAMLLDALKALAGIDPEVKLLATETIEAIQTLKTKHLGSRNPRLHTDEVLIALSVSAGSDENARRARAELHRLAGCDVHTTTILGTVDEGIFRNLGVNVTSEPVYQHARLYRKK
mgnify:CR=1 FL=1